MTNLIPEQEPFVLADVAKRRVAFLMREVLEIVPMMSLSCEDRMGSTCRGVAQIRGNLVEVFELYGSTSVRDLNRLIVILQGQNNRRLGVLVDDVLELTNVTPDQILEQHHRRGTSTMVACIQGQVLPVIRAREVNDGH